MSAEWLPALLLLKEDGGDWQRYLDRLHARFLDDFVRTKPEWPGKRVGLKRHPEYDGKSATFWHMISEGDQEAGRIPDMRRCERIGWPRPIMDAFDGSRPRDGARLLWWKEERRGEERYLLALTDFSYVVVVADRGDFVLPWTAYCVEQPHRRAKLRKAWEAFWNAQKG